jgi:hypothetical protein
MKIAYSMIAATAASAAAQSIQSEVTPVSVNYEWGYRCGVKQALGSYSLGHSVYNIAKETGEGRGSPDYLMWFNESEGWGEIRELGHDDANVLNPGGQADFGDDGRVWYMLGARARDLPFDLLRFDEPFSLEPWSLAAEGVVTYGASTTPCLHVKGDLGLHSYRYSGSSRTGEVQVRVQRLDLNSGLVVDETPVARGSSIGQQRIGIEQLWTRYDSRMGAIALTWQWWDVDSRLFGSNPFVWSEDDGVTWKDASGRVLDLPLAYEERDETLVPYDHIERVRSTSWQPGEIGWTPGGVPFLMTQSSDLTLNHWRWTGSEWDRFIVTDRIRYDSKPYAAGTTRDFAVIFYATLDEPETLWMITSRDDGETWSAPAPVIELDDDAISTVTWIQPRRYLDNTARVAVLHYRKGGNYNSRKNYRNAVSYVKVQIGPRSDFDGDGTVDTRDVLAFLAAWASGSWTADFDDSGQVDSRDFIEFLNAFASES